MWRMPTVCAVWFACVVSTKKVNEKGLFVGSERKHSAEHSLEWNVDAADKSSARLTVIRINECDTYHVLLS